MKFLEKGKLGRHISGCLGLEVGVRMTAKEHKGKFGHDGSVLK